MAGIRGNQAWFMAAKQATKGTPATPAVATTYKNPFSGGNISPVREVEQLQETDASRDVGVSYVSASGVEGSPEFYVRDSSIAAYLYWALGAVASSGVGPNYTHTITPGSALPYITAWKSLGDLLWEQYLDCKVGTLTIAAEAGQPLVATAAIQGAQASRLTADPSVTPAIPLESSQVYNFNQASITLGGGATALIRSFELTIENNLTRQQTDSVSPYDVYAGTREVSLGFDLYFETLDEYNKFHYGGAAGTAISDTIFTTSATFDFSLGTNNSVGFNLPSIAYQEFPVEPSAAGDPVVSSVRAVAQRGGSPVLTATVKNQIISY